MVILPSFSGAPPAERSATTCTGERTAEQTAERTKAPAPPHELRPETWTH
jgi:hypothetical protein